MDRQRGRWCADSDLQLRGREAESAVARCIPALRRVSGWMRIEVNLGAKLRDE